MRHSSHRSSHRTSRDVTKSRGMSELKVLGWIAGGTVALLGLSALLKHTHASNGSAPANGAGQLGQGGPVMAIPTETGTPNATLLTISRGNRFTVNMPDGTIQRYVATGPRDTSGPEPLYPAVNATTGVFTNVPLTSINTIIQ